MKKYLFSVFVIVLSIIVLPNLLYAQEQKSLFNELYDFMEKYEKKCPDVTAAFYALHDTIVMKEGKLSIKEKELIALGIAITTRCDYCIYFHTAQAKKSGATDEEILEASSVAVYMGGGPAFSYIKYVVDALEELSKMKEEATEK